MSSHSFRRSSKGRLQRARSISTKKKTGPLKARGMRVTIAPGTTVKDRDGKILANPGETVSLPTKIAESLIKGGSARKPEKYHRTINKPLSGTTSLARSTRRLPPQSPPDSFNILGARLEHLFFVSSGERDFVERGQAVLRTFWEETHWFKEGHQGRPNKSRPDVFYAIAIGRSRDGKTYRDARSVLQLMQIAKNGLMKMFKFFDRSGSNHDTLMSDDSIRDNVKLWLLLQKPIDDFMDKDWRFLLSARGDKALVYQYYSTEWLIQDCANEADKTSNARVRLAIARCGKIESAARSLNIKNLTSPRHTGSYPIS